MFWTLFFGIMGVALALFGAMCAIEMIVEACFPDRRIFTVVEIQTLEDADVLDLLLIEAKRTSLRSASSRVGVLMSPSLLYNGEIPKKTQEVLDRFDVECYLCE